VIKLSAVFTPTLWSVWKEGFNTERAERFTEIAEDNSAAELYGLRVEIIFLGCDRRPR